MNNQKYGFLNGVPIDPGKGKEIVPLLGVPVEGAEYTCNGTEWREFYPGNYKRTVSEWIDVSHAFIAIRRPITKPALPFPIDPAFDYIVTEDDRERFSPKLVTDEYWHYDFCEWKTITPDTPFHHNNIYRRHKEETNLASLELYGTICIHHNDAERKFDRCPVCLIKQLRTTIDDHVAKALITNHIIKLSAEEVTRLHATIDAQKKVIDEAGMVLHKCKDYLWGSVRDKNKIGQRLFDNVSTTLTAIRKLEEGK